MADELDQAGRREPSMAWVWNCQIDAVRNRAIALRSYSLRSTPSSTITLVRQIDVNSDTLGLASFPCDDSNIHQDIKCTTHQIMANPHFRRTPFEHKT